MATRKQIDSSSPAKPETDRSAKGLPQFAAALGLPVVAKRLEVLRQVASAGSISQAARNLGISYKAAWVAIHQLSQQAKAPMLNSAIGGSGGGGATLTEVAHQLLSAAERLRQDRLKVETSPVNAVSLRTSMRNQFTGQILSLARVASAVVLHIQLSPSVIIKAQITQTSVKALGLKANTQLLVMFKATAVQVVPLHQARVADNVLSGIISNRIAQRGSTEVTVAVNNQIEIVGFSKHPFPAKNGSAVSVTFDASAVVIALPN